MLAVQLVVPLPILNGVHITEASILSNVASMLGSSVTPVLAFSDDSAPNSQEMPLLQAPANPLGSSTATSTQTTDTADAINAITGLLPKTSPSPSVAPTVQAATVISSTDTTSDETSALSQNNEISTYTVVSGDTVSGIAQKFGISVNTVLWANNLRKTSILKAGKKLTILPITGVSHTVVKGDTLQSIASTYKGDVQEIMAYNNMPDSTLSIGDVIVVPNGEFSGSSSSSSNSIEDSTAPSKIVVSGLADGYYMRPIKGGERTQGIHGKNAVDLADSCGTSIYASAAGTVTVSKDDNDWNGGYGNYVVISHNNGSQTLYAHMEHPTVSEGDTVAQGQQIGLMGETGEATGCHVHFEIRNGPVNPF